jgi:hypothetical protein
MLKLNIGSNNNFVVKNSNIVIQNAPQSLEQQHSQKAKTKSGAGSRHLAPNFITDQR